MVIDSKELDRIADDIDRQRRITSSTYCGSCGYNLRTLPYAYSCPECGNEYNARPLIMEGVFLPFHAEFPMREVLITVIGAASTVVIGYGAINPVDKIRLVISLFFLLITCSFATQTALRIKRFVKGARIAHRIKLDEEAEYAIEQEAEQP